MRNRNTSTTVRGLILAAVLFVFCGSSLVAGGRSEGAEGAAEQQLKIWYEASYDFDPLFDPFLQENPNVEFAVETMRTEDMRSTIQVALPSGTGPDVFLYDTGPGYAGALVQAEMLLPLDSYYDRYGWHDRFYDWTIDRATFDGVPYGISQGLEYLGVFYNRAIFDELDLAVPSTYQEFLEVCETLRRNDYIPVAFANQGKWPAYHMFSIFANTLAGKDKMDALLFEGGNVQWNDPEFVEAIRLPFSQLAGNGYFIEGTNGVSYDDGNLLFYTGRAGMHITGMWLLDDIMKTVEKPEDIGFFAFPDIQGKPSLPPAGVSSGFFVSADTEYPDTAAALLDSIFSQEMGPVWIRDVGSIPPFPVKLDPLDLSPLEENMIATMQEVSQRPDAGMGYNIDVLTPQRFNEMMGSGFQSVIAGEKTPEEQANDLQRIWLAEKSN